MSKHTYRIALCAVLFVAAQAGHVRGQWSVEFLSPQIRTGIAATSLDGKAFFGGGIDPTYTVGSVYDIVDVYDEATDTWSTETLPTPRGDAAAAAVGEYVLFAGGLDANLDSSAAVEILHVPTGQWASTTLSIGRRGMGATTVGNKVLFAGGQAGTLFSPILSAVVDVYDADLGDPDDPAAWSTTNLDTARNYPAATTVGDLALFAGGTTGGNYTAVVDIYDNSSDSWSTTQLSEARLVGTESATTVGTRAYFAGGQNHLMATPFRKVIDIYDAQTGAWTTDELSVARARPATVAAGHTILFAGGYTAAGVPNDVVDVFDAGTGTWLPTDQLPQGALGGIVRTAVNGKAFFAGGNNGISYTSKVHVYEPVVAGPWTGLGYALPGTHGDPILLGDGPLTTGSAGSLTLSNAADTGALALLFVSFASTPTPFRGGTLVTVPSFTEFGFSTVGSPGGVTLPWLSWPNGLSGASLYFQYGIQDAGAPLGAALSNALRADVP